MNHLLRLTPDSQQGPRDREAMLKYFLFLMWLQSGFEKDLKQNLTGSSLLQHYRKATVLEQQQHPQEANFLLKKLVGEDGFLTAKLYYYSHLQ